MAPQRNNPFPACTRIVLHSRLIHPADPAIKRRFDMEEIGKVIPAAFRSYLQREAPRVVEVLSPLWSHVVGKALAQHSRPVGFEKGTLKLAASCASWSIQLRRMSEEIRLEVNRYLGYSLVKKVIVRHRSARDVWVSGAADENGESWTPDGDAVTRGSRPDRSAPSVTPGADPPPNPQPSSLRTLKRSNAATVLSPEVARILDQSFAKYFSRAAAQIQSRKVN